MEESSAAGLCLVASRRLATMVAAAAGAVCALSAAPSRADSYLSDGPAGAPVALPAIAPGAAAASQPSTQPAVSKPGRWTCWTGDEFFRPMAASPKALWFGGQTGAHIWRYDIETQQIKVFSTLDGLPLEAGPLLRMATAKDERCAILIIRNLPMARVFVWWPKLGWRAPPVPQGDGCVLDIAFDHDDNLLALVGRGAEFSISRLDGERWQPVRTVPQSRSLVALAEGFVTADTDGKTTTVYYTPSTGGASTRTTKGPFYDCQDFFCFRPHDKTLCLSLKPMGGISAMDTGCELGPEGFRERFTGKFIGADLKAGGFFGSRVIERTDERIVLEPNVPGSPRIELPFDTCGTFVPLVDQNGHLWVGRQRWDGRQWKQFTSGFDLPMSVYGAAGARARLSDDGNRWTPIDPLMPRRLYACDMATHTGWMSTPGPGKGELRLIRFTPAGRQVVQTIPFEKYIGMPEFKTADGDWWWVLSAGDGKYMIRRLTAEGIRDYPTDGYDLILSRNGNVWCKGFGNNYTRYDPKSDRFERAEPWEEFAFTVGDWRLSLVSDRNGGVLHVCENGTWVPFRTPFSPHDVWAVPGCVRGDRVLMTLGGGEGVVEYNATRKKWARLTDSWQNAAFDDRGRRMFWSFGMLVYDGDPFASGVLVVDDEAEFRRLLKRMDDDQWKVRDAATRELAGKLGKFGARAAAAADDPSQSLEVRNRLRSILPQDKALGPSLAPMPPALLQIMHPAVVPDG